MSGIANTALVAAIPFVVELFWIGLWWPAKARQLREQQELEERGWSTPASFGPYDTAFALYHLPLMVIGLVILRRPEQRRAGRGFEFVMGGTPPLYSFIAVVLMSYLA